MLCTYSASDLSRAAKRAAENNSSPNGLHFVLESFGNQAMEVAKTGLHEHKEVFPCAAEKAFELKSDLQKMLEEKGYQGVEIGVVNSSNDTIRLLYVSAHWPVLEIVPGTRR